MHDAIPLSYLRHRSLPTWKMTVTRGTPQCSCTGVYIVPAFSHLPVSTLLATCLAVPARLMWDLAKRFGRRRVNVQDASRGFKYGCESGIALCTSAVAMKCWSEMLGGVWRPQSLPQPRAKPAARARAPAQRSLGLLHLSRLQDWGVRMNACCCKPTRLAFCSDCFSE